jgi:hypothetical protein
MSFHEVCFIGSEFGWQSEVPTTGWNVQSMTIKVKVKVKGAPVLFSNWAQRHEGVFKERMYSSTHSLTSALDGGEWSASRPGRFTPRETAPGTHWIGGWVGPRTVLDTEMKRKIPSLCRESNPSTQVVQPVAQRYTDSAVTQSVAITEKKMFGWSLF